MLRRFTLSRTARTLFIAVAAAVSLAPLGAQDYAATALIVSGDVSRLNDGNKWALTGGNAVKPKEIIKTGHDGYARFKVSDGSTFEVFPDSEVTFRERPGSWQNLLNIWIGHVKVYIQHLPGVPNPNNVASPTAIISVRGTVFDVNVEDADGTTFVTVDEGAVEVRHWLLGGKGVTLQPGESIRVFRNQPIATMVDKGNILHNVFRAAQQAVYDTLSRRGIGGVGGNPRPVPSGGGPQADKGKNGGDSGTGNGAPPPPTGAPPPPPPPPGGGG